jgi:hypothetical protein
VPSRHRVLPALCAVALIVPAVVWLWPAVAAHQAPSFRDQGDFFYPLKLYTADRLRAQEIPLWNPLSGTGEPWLANLQSGVFYPPAWLFLLAAPGLAAAAYLGIHFALGAWGTWRFAKTEGVSDSAALLSSGVFTACGFTASLSAYWNHFGAWAYLPAVAALVRGRLSSRASRLSFAGLIGLQAMAGSPEISAATLLLAAVFSLARAETSQDGWAPETAWQLPRRTAVSAALGFALAGWVLVPFGELAALSGRTSTLPSPEREYGTVGWGAVASALGLPSAGSATPYLSSIFLGPVTLFCLAAALLAGERRGLILRLAAIGAAGILLSASGPPGRWLRELPPLDRLRFPSKALCLTVFAVAALAGLGADSVRFLARRSRWRAIALAAVGAVLAATVLYSRLPLPVRATGAAGLVAMLLLLSPRISGIRSRGVLVAGAALMLLTSLVLAGGPLFRFAPEEEIRRQPETIGPLRRLPGRVLTPPGSELFYWILRDERFDSGTLRRQRESLQGYTNLLFGIPTVRTAAALPTRGARRLLDSIDTSEHPESTAAATSARVLWSPFRPARLPSRKRGEFFEIPISPYLPRLSVVHHYRVLADPERAWEEASRGAVDWSREVLLDRAPPPSPPNPQPGPKLLVAGIAEDRPERVVAQVTTGAPGILVLTDLWYPGWVAESDGKRVDILRANGFFRGVPLAAGSHRVVFRYRPVSFFLGAALSVVALGAMAILAWRGEPARRTAAL